ncbi:MAG: primase protein [Candidatus Roizmanbacteria bacterium GW2011_GWA1_41_13]|uniref:DNA primase n=2 Tax=Candidatus Roizmaniibacteriota TaxID=1752723 RepID=A0A0G0V017_9BACT|nr:MAG: primase protein [Candidatus Roizmanbacteria bacterium GW2011_GWA1_41_13]
MRDADQIKEKIDIVEFIQEYVPLKKAGRNFKGLCPFHSEKSPSFYVAPDRQIWHCFGACDEGGDVISFYMKIENVTFPEALTELARRVGMTLTSSYEHDETWKQRSRLYEIHHLASEYYHYVLTKHAIGSAGRDYLTNRAISEKIIKTFMLGYAPSGWRNLLPFLMKKGYHEDEIETAGLIIRGKNGYYDRFRGRVMFTLKDHRGNIVGFSGRLLSKEAKEAKYINSPETPLYHKSKVLYGLDVTAKSISEADQAIICEGEFDVLTSFESGISNIVAIKGTALTQDQLKILKRYTNNLLLALDMDFAGDQAARRSIELAEELDFNIKVASLTSGKDLDEAIQKDIGKTKEEIENAPSVYDFLLTSAVKRYGGTDSVAKKQIAGEVISLYATIQNSIVRDFFVKKLAKTIEVSEEAVIEQLQKEQKKKQSLPASSNLSPRQSNHKSRQERLEEHLLSLVVQSNSLSDSLQKVDQTITIEELATPSIRRVLLLLKENKQIPSELAYTYNRAYLRDIQSIVSDATVFNKEINETLTEVKKGLLRMKLQKIATKLRTEEDEGSLNEDFKRVSEELKKL